MRLKFEHDKFENIIRIINSIKMKRVLVIGDIILDEFVYGYVERVSSGIQIPVIEKKSTEFYLGGAANIAANMASFSSNITMIGNIGEDFAGEQVKKLLRKYNIDYDLSYCGTTVEKQRIYVDGQQTVRIDESKCTGLDFSLYKEILDEYLEKIDILVLADYAYGVCSKELCEYAIGKCNEKNIPVIVTSRDTSNLDKFSNASCIVLNQYEAQSICSIGEEMMIKKPIAGVSEYLITLGKKGICYLYNDKSFIDYVKEIYPVNVSGAGDTVFSVFASLFNEKIEKEVLLHILNFCGGLAVKDEKTYVLDKERFISEYFQFLRQQNCTNKILKLETAKCLVNSWKANNQTVIFTNGCYDLLHLGHIRSFDLAKRKGDRLIVAVNSDAAIKRLKGNQRPINTLEERLAILAYLEMIDLIIPFDEDTAIGVIKELRPDVYVKGEEYKNKDLPEAEYVPKVELVPMLEGISTTNVISRIETMLGDKNE